MPFDPRVEFHRVVIKSCVGASLSSDPFSSTTMTQTTLKAYSTGGQRSSRVASLAGANGLVVLPILPGDGNGNGKRKTRYEVGDWARAIVIGDIEMEVV